MLSRIGRDALLDEHAQVSPHDNTLLQTGPLGNTLIRQALDQKTPAIATENPVLYPCQELKKAAADAANKIAQARACYKKRKKQRQRSFHSQLNELRIGAKCSRSVLSMCTLQGYTPMEQRIDQGHRPAACRRKIFRPPSMRRRGLSTARAGMLAMAWMSMCAMTAVASPMLFAMVSAAAFRQFAKSAHSKQLKDEWKVAQQQPFQQRRWLMEGMEAAEVAEKKAEMNIRNQERFITQQALLEMQWEQALEKAACMEEDILTTAAEDKTAVQKEKATEGKAAQQVKSTPRDDGTPCLDAEELHGAMSALTLSMCSGMQATQVLEALLDDLERIQTERTGRIQTERTGNIRVVLRTESGETEAFVSPLDTVADAVGGALCTGLSNIESILLDGQDVSDSTFEEFGIENGARLTVIIRRAIRTKAQVEALVDEIAACNPGANRVRMLREAEFDADGNLQNWNLSNNNLESLPDSFGSLKFGGLLNLQSNKLESLPASFGSLQVGGSLCLDRNKLKSLPDSFGSLQVGGWGCLRLNNNNLESLPDSFGSLQVRGDLDLSRNKLESLPDSFGSLQTFGSLQYLNRYEKKMKTQYKLDLSNNQLESLPDSFGSLRVGRCLNLSNNQLESLPDSFGSLEVWGDVDLRHNKLESLPDSFGSLRVNGGDVDLSNNQLESLPDSFGSLKIGGHPHTLDLRHNKLESLPDSFGSLKIGGHHGGHLYLNNNPIEPASYSSDSYDSDY